MAATTLFNDATLSDVKVVQIHNENIREYYAHKAVLCSQSTYFMKAFTGRFKEASKTMMNLRDDDPVHSDFALKFMYTLDYDVDAIAAILGSKNDTMKGFEFAMGIIRVADKYEIKRLVEPGFVDLQRNLDTISDTKTLASVAKAFYATSPDCGTRFAKIIIKTIFMAHHNFISSDEFAVLCRVYPIFAADMMTTFARVTCSGCRITIVASSSHRASGVAYSLHCP